MNTRKKPTTKGSRGAHGFTLIASLLLLLLLSVITIGLMVMVNTEIKAGGTDLQNNLAYRAAEGGIEKMASDLNATFQNIAVPSPSQICAVGASSNQPTMTGVIWKDYSVQPGTTQSSTCPTSLSSTWGTITGNGQNAGLSAEIIPVNMLATASVLGGQEVSMTRQAQVALIPAFQFGVFSEGDLLFENGGTLDFAGPVHTNADLYPFSGGGILTFHDKVSAWGNVIRTQLPNGIAATTNYTGAVYIPTAQGNCAQGGGASSTCIAMATPGTSSPFGDGSVTGAGSATAQTGSTYIPTLGTDTWSAFSKTTTNSELVNGNYGSTATKAAGTGAKKLSLSFVGGGAQPFEIIRQPPTGEDPNSAVSQAREYNLAQIHVLLADDPAELPGGASDNQNIRLANLTAAQAQLQSGSASSVASNPWGISISSANYGASFTAPAAGNNYTLYFAAASNAVPIPATCSGSTCSTPDWPYAPIPWTANTNFTGQGLQPTGSLALAPIFRNNAASTTTIPTINLCPPTAVAVASIPAGCPSPATGAYPYYSSPNPVGATNYNSASSNAWSLIDGYLRVEYQNSSGNWIGVTSEWLSLGFARGSTAPTLSGSSAPAAGTNPINPNAILLLQEPADRLTAAPTGLTAAAVPATPAISGASAPSACAAYTLSACTTPAIPPVCTTTIAGVCVLWTAGVPPILVSDSGLGGEWAFGVTPTSPVASPVASATPQSLTQYNWYPINFYDAREGEVREQSWTVASQPSNATDTTCSTQGVMNAIEIDVGNLKRWLAGSTGSSGASVDYVAQNGYLLYFSDRRGMLLNPNGVLPVHPANSKSGDSGLEDVINSSSQVGTPDGVLDPIPSGRTYSPEDVNENGYLDNWGANNLGLGFWGTGNSATQNLNTLINSGAHDDPYGTGGSGTAGYTSNRIAKCGTTARKNWVSGARHVLKLVDGTYGNLPRRPVPLVVGGTSYYGGFTVASENPVYIQGDYNSSPTEYASWTTPPTLPTDLSLHSAASVIADSVTLLSNNWDDRRSTLGIAANPSPTRKQNRMATQNTYYRAAISLGKNANFTSPNWVLGTVYDVGIDGALGNMMRLMEDWSQNPSVAGKDTLNYFGSLVTLYYQTYNTGIFKCGACWEVYGNGNRNYTFDTDFTVPQQLPPGTPMFHDVESLSYRQSFATRTY